MTIGIIGAGNIGSAFARTLARAGIEATIANSRGPDSLVGLVRELGPRSRRARASKPRAQTSSSSRQLDETSGRTGRPADWGGRIVIDANNPIEAPLFKPVDLNGRLSSEVFADLVPGARVVKAFNHLQAHVLAGDPRAEGGRRVLFYSGDDAGAKAEVGALIDRHRVLRHRPRIARDRRAARPISRRAAAGS